MSLSGWCQSALLITTAAAAAPAGGAAAGGGRLRSPGGGPSRPPQAPRRAVSVALEKGADPVAVSADLELRGLWEAIFISYFVSIFNLSQRRWDVRGPRSSAHIGIGAFNLVRASAYARAGGHERLRMELLDDLGLGLIVKKSGARSMLAGHDGLVRARWQEGIGGVIGGGGEKGVPPPGRRAVPATGSVRSRAGGAPAPAP